MPAETKKRKKKDSLPTVIVLMPTIVKDKSEDKSKDEKTDDEKDDKEESDDEDSKEEDEDDEDPGEDVTKLKDRLAKEKEKTKKARAESIDRRKKNKELTEKTARLEKGLAIIQGKEKADLDPIEEAQKLANAKMRKAILKGELAVMAKDAHAPSELMMVAPALFADIDVDVENESVDADALKEAVDGLRKSKPYLFSTPADEGDLGDQTRKKIKPPPGTPPAKGKDAYSQWKQLKAQGRHSEAAEYHKKNHKEIKSAIAANPSLV